MGESKWGKENKIDVYIEMMNFLSEGSADCFFLGEFGSQRIYFSKNTREMFAIMQEGKNYCTLDELLDSVFPKDRSDLREKLHEETNKKDHIFYEEFRMKTRGGEVVWVCAQGRCITPPGSTSGWMLGRFSQTAMNKKIDALTGAFNLDALHEDLKEIISQERDGYFLLVSTNRLKQINLRWGREFGDSLLKLIAGTLEQVTGGQRVYRMYGDCFAVSLLDAQKQEAEAVFSQVKKQLRRKCTLSAGCVSLREYKIPDAATMLQYAETSLEYAEKQGKNRLWFFTAGDYEKDFETVQLKEDLRKSVEQGFEGFSLCYQAQVSTEGCKLYGAEALLRYQSPRRGKVSPVEFVPLLEDSGLICQVGAWVLRTALAQCKKWREILPDFHISVNMSSEQLREEGITETVLQALKDSGLPGHALTIEVTESREIFEYSRLGAIFRQWKQFDIEISVDDFGTGYSSLGRLKNFDIDEIKIDRCFVTNIQDSVYNYRLLQNIVDLADSNQIRVCCEGMETEEELAVLETLSPKLLQGYLFSKPYEPDVFEKDYIRRSSTVFEKWAAQKSRRTGLLSASTLELRESDITSAILESEEDIFYVSDPDTYELYYMNKAGRNMLGDREYHGKKCYQVLQGLDAPCPFCTNPMLKQDEFYIWERENPLCGRRFLIKDKLISCKGRKMRLEVALDITEMNEKEAQGSRFHSGKIEK